VNLPHVCGKVRSFLESMISEGPAACPCTICCAVLVKATISLAFVCFLFAYVMIIAEMLCKVVLPLKPVASTILLAIYAAVSLRVLLVSGQMPFENVQACKG
jgi:hypothetical protein